MSQAKFYVEVAPGTPEAGYLALYPKADKKLYYKDDAGLETAIAGGSGDDNFSYNLVPISTTVTIPLNQQMIVYQLIEIIGTLDTIGDLVIID